MFAGLLAAGAPARAALPAPPDLDVTAAEQATLAQGDVVVRVQDSDKGALTIAAIDVSAPPAAVLDAVLDFPPRAKEVGSIRDVQVYARRPESDPTEIGVKWTLSVIGRAVTFHTLYDIDRARNFCTYRLDPDRPNDLHYVDGSYRAFKIGGGSRLVYRSTTDVGMVVPNWLRRWLTSGSLKEQLMGIKARAEQSRSGSTM